MKVERGFAQRILKDSDVQQYIEEFAQREADRMALDAEVKQMLEGGELDLDAISDPELLAAAREYLEKKKQ